MQNANIKLQSAREGNSTMVRTLILLASVATAAVAGPSDSACARAEYMFFNRHLNRTWLDSAYSMLAAVHNADPQNERFLNPADFTEALGITKDLIKQEKCAWSTRLGAGFRQHLNREALNPVTEKRETETSNDGGIEFVSDFRSLSAQEHLELTSKLIVFEAIYFSKANSLRGFPYASYWKAPDIRWDNTLTASITKYMMVSLYTQFLYDKEIDLGGRFKQTLSLGLTYKLK